MKRILVVDDHIALGEGKKAILEKEKEFFVQVVTSAEEALKMNEVFDLYIVDVQMQGLSGIELSKILIEENKDLKIILCTGFDIQESVSYFTDIGVKGFISKTSTSRELISFVYSVLAGYTLVPSSILNDVKNHQQKIESELLSEMERDIVRCVSNGLSNEEIADRLFMSKRTVEYHLSKIYVKLNAKNRGEAVKNAIKRGVVV